MPARRTTFFCVLSALMAAALATRPGEVSGQGRGTVRSDENFRREPNGVVLGRLAAGAPLRVLERTGSWIQVDVEGWVWLNSLQASGSEFDLVVAVEGGENLRSAPSGAIVGRLEQGTLLEELAREPGWAQVRRRGWIWSASVSEAAATTSASARTASGTGAAPAGPAPSAAPPARRPDGFTTVGAAGAPILTAPDGDTLARVRPSSDLQVIAREGNWARVRLEGWVWMPAGADADAEAPVVSEAPSTLVPQDLTGEPEAHVGRVVSWALQFISLERAEEIRTDFRQGEPFLLTRFGGPDGPFVYVAVPSERLTEAQGLVPLERIVVTGRVRTGASSFTGTPIIDLLSLERTR